MGHPYLVNELYYLSLMILLFKRNRTFILCRYAVITSASKQQQFLVLALEQRNKTEFGFFIRMPISTLSYIIWQYYGNLVLAPSFVHQSCLGHFLLCHVVNWPLYEVLILQITFVLKPMATLLNICSNSDRQNSNMNTSESDLLIIHFLCEKSCQLLQANKLII